MKKPKYKIGDVVVVCLTRHGFYPDWLAEELSGPDEEADFFQAVIARAYYDNETKDWCYFTSCDQCLWDWAIARKL